MKCVILCAGYATRLYPLTENKAKALLEVGGMALLTHTINNLLKVVEIDEIFVVTNNKFHNHFLKWNLDNDKIKIINNSTRKNEDRLGGVIDLSLAFNEFEDEELMVILGDNYFGFDFRNFIDYFNTHKKTSVALYDVKEVEQAKLFGIIDIDEDDKIIGFVEKPENPKSTLASTGGYIFCKEDVKNISDYINSDKKKDGIGFIIEDFIKNNIDIKGFVFCEPWVDIGSYEDYEKLNEMLGGN